MSLKSRRHFREALFDLVWTTPIKTLAAQYGVSDVAFAKTCKQHNLPLPPRGYWAKLEAGKQVYRPPLPERALGMPREIIFGGDKWHYYGPAPKNLIDLELIPPQPFDETLAEVRDKVSKRVKKVTVSRDLSLAHPVIRKLLDADIPRRQKYLASSYRSSFDEPYFESPFEQRRLRVLNALFLCLEKNDARVTTSGKNPDNFYVRVGLTEVSVSVDDPKAERTSWRSTSEITKPASSVLTVQISKATTIEGVQTAWLDKPDDKIEGHLTDIAINILVAGESACRHKEASHYKWLSSYKAELIERARKEKEEAERAERQRRLEEEQARVDRLLSEAKTLREAEEIRAYVTAVLKVNETSVDPVPENDLNDWKKWAWEQADRIDPVRSRRFLQDRR